MKGIYLNDIPMDLFLKYFTSEDLQDRLLEPKLIPDVRDYYVYDVAVDTDTYTMYSTTPEDQVDSLKEQAVIELSGIVSGIETGDIDSVTLVSTVSSAQMYVSETIAGATYPNRYRFEFASDGQVEGFIEVDGSIDTISDTSSISITDSRDTSTDILGYLVNLSLNSAESRYYVYNASFSALVGYIYENDAAQRQKTDDLGRPLYVDESGNETAEGFRGSRALRHNEAIRGAFFAGSNITDPRELSLAYFMPGVVGLYRQGSDRQLIYHELFDRSLDYERITLSGETYSDTVIPQSIKDELASVGDEYSVNTQERKLRTLIDFANVRRINAGVYDEPTFVFTAGSEVASMPGVGETMIVAASKRIINYEGKNYESSSVAGQETILVGSDNLDVFYNENLATTFVRLPVKKELNPSKSKYIKAPLFSSRNESDKIGYVYTFNAVSSTWTQKSLESVQATKNESEVKFDSGPYISTTVENRQVRIPLYAGQKVFITSTKTLKKVNSGETALEAASGISDHIYCSAGVSYNGAQSGLYIYSGSAWSLVPTSEYAQAKPLDSEIYTEYITVGTTRFTISESSAGVFSNPTINGAVYQIKRDSAKPIYSLGYIEYRVSVSRDTTGVEYFGQVSAVSGSNFTLSKYAPTYSDTGVNGDDFDLEGFTYNSLDGTYSRTYYLRDMIDRSLAVEVVEVISKSGDNADDASTPKWTEFIDYEHSIVSSGEDFTTPAGDKIDRGSAVTSPSRLNTFMARFSEFGHSLVDGSFRISTRGDLIPDNIISSKRAEALGRMAADFLNRPGVNLFTVANIGQDEDSPMKMRLYCEALVSMSASAPRFSGSEPKRRSEPSLSERVILQRAEQPSDQAIPPAVYSDDYFAEEGAAAAAAVSSLNSIQKLAEYQVFPTNEARLISEFGSRARQKIMSQHTSTESALDYIGSTPFSGQRVTRTSRLAFKPELSRDMSEFFYSSNSYSDRNFNVNNYYEYYKDKLDSIQSPVYPDEDSSFSSYKRTLLRSSLELDPEPLVEKILSRLEGGEESEWRVL